MGPGIQNCHKMYRNPENCFLQGPMGLAVVTAAGANIAAAGCSDGNLGPDFSDGNLGPDLGLDFSDGNLGSDFSDGHHGPWRK